jgi:phage host-nuclease inhibitor protein Gam
MATKRRKAEVLPAVQSRGEAIAALTRYAEIAGQIAARDVRVAAAAAQLRGEADRLNAPLVAEQEAIFLAIKPWWAVAGAGVTEGDRKTAELGGCLLGHRIGNPTLKYPTPEATAVRLLIERGWQGLLRIKYELDKPAIMAALRWLAAPARVAEAIADERTIDAGDGGDADPDLVGAIAWFKAVGFKITQKEEFFIDRLPPTDAGANATAVAGTQTIADPAAQQVAA